MLQGLFSRAEQFPRPLAILSPVKTDQASGLSSSAILELWRNESKI